MTINLTFDPIVARIGQVDISWQGIFTALALALGVWLAVRNASRLSITIATCGHLILLTLLGGVISGRLVHLATHWLYYSANPGEAATLWDGGASLYGALLGGSLVLWLAARRQRLAPWALLDAAAPAALAGVALGRIGCLLVGAAWGVPTDAPWGVIYWNPGDVLPPNLLSLPLHPYPLYEFAAVLAVLGGLWLLRRRLTFTGSTFLVAATGYAIIRLGLAGFRPEPEAVQLLALTSGLICCCLLLLIAPGRRWVHIALSDRKIVSIDSLPFENNHTNTTRDRHAT